MISFAPCHYNHFDYIKPLAVQSDEYRALWGPGYREGLLSGIALSAWASGVCVGAAGVFEPHAGRGEAWALLGEGAGSYLLTIVRRMRFVLQTHPARRIDMLVTDGNGNGHVLAELCGFVYETKLEAYHPSGRDAFMYKRMRQ